MSNDHDPIKTAMQCSDNIADITRRMAASLDDMKRMLDSFPTIEVAFDIDSHDMPEDESYSTGLARNCRYMGEMLFACYMAGINFTIEGNDNHEGYVQFAEIDGVPSVGDFRYISTGNAFTTSDTARSIALALAEVLESTIKRRAQIVSPEYEIEVSIVDGRFIDYHTGEILANNVIGMVRYCNSANCDVVICPDYD